ncbi:MAG: amidohydrolase family protein [Candidatus Aureabacteria bacterium]|nr:amidohydrolase family protein [Candidatus Auribacterota bacterium]
MVIDFHTHAFPDDLAERALSRLREHSGDYRAYHDATVRGLLISMNRAGIDAAIVASIATKPEQTEKIIRWSLTIQGPRIIPFASLHPTSRHFAGELEKIAASGLKGVKLHPMYQEFTVDDPLLFPLYQAIAERGLILLLHAGFDIAFPGNHQADPTRILNVHNAVPNLKIVASHLGGWRLWEEVLETLAGKPVYLETSFAAREADPQLLRAILDKHSPEFLLFGTDSPWLDQKEELLAWRQLDIPPKLRDKILFRNAERLLGLEPSEGRENT